MAYITLPLTLPQIQQNCESIYNYSFRNIVVQEDGTVTGFSNLNMPLKVAKLYTDWSTEYKDYQKLYDAVIKTLESIKDQFNTQPEECPLFFYMDRIRNSYGPVSVTYRKVAERIINSVTFKDCEKVQNKAKDIVDLYDKHSFGSDKMGLEEKDLKLFKDRLFEEVTIDLKKRYLSGMSFSLQSLQAVNLFSKDPIILPPENALDVDGMKNYLQKKVQILKTQNY